MHEAFLHFLWKYTKLNTLELKTTADETLIILNVGQHNYNSGPDFFNARIVINEQEWAGNVEIHLKSSDWYLHNHQQDNTYQNVILHVVWEHDTEVFRQNNACIPTLELKHYVDETIWNNYKQLSASSSKWIYCEENFSQIDNFLLENWLERLYIERLERKWKDIEKLLLASKNNWEAVLYKLLAKNFGLKVNGESFLSIANSLEWQIVSKLAQDLKQMEATFFGLAGLLEDDIQEAYYLELQKEYTYLKHKFQLHNQGVLPIQFFRLRPTNFPTIRLAQFAMLYYKRSNLFSKLMEVKSKEEAYRLFSISVSEFWKTHYTFKTNSKLSHKKLSKSFIDLLLINTVIPLQFAYNKHLGKQVANEILELAISLAPEKNSIVDKFHNLKSFPLTAMHSQAFIQLKNEYCNKQKCVDCAIGNSILRG